MKIHFDKSMSLKHPNNVPRPSNYHFSFFIAFHKKFPLFLIKAKLIPQICEQLGCEI